MSRPRQSITSLFTVMKGYWRADMSRLIPSGNADQSTTETGIAESETQLNTALSSARVLENRGQFLGED
jgi:hypothetical protein